MALWRGFKSEANTLALEVRSELGLHSTAPLDPRELAARLEIPLLTLSDFRTVIPQAVKHFSHVKTGAFSAATVFDGTRRVVVYNDAHSPVRQVSDLAHELSHGLLLHEPRPALDSLGCRVWDEDCEDEADWLSGALLVSEEAALLVVRLGLELTEAARRYQVSQTLMRWRINVTGAKRRVQRAQKYSM